MGHPTTSDTPALFRISFAKGDRQGSRDKQEDYIACQAFHPTETGRNEAELVCTLADGMGGMEGGDVASSVVVTSFMRSIENLQAENTSIPDKLIRAMIMANQALAQRKKGDHPHLNTMGCTLCAVWIQGSKLYYINVGDSYIYLMRGQQLFRLNNLHTHREDMYREADKCGTEHSIVDKDPSVIQYGARLTSYIGGIQIKQADCPAQAVELIQGDIILLSSDGIQTIGEENIARILLTCKTQGATPEEMVNSLLDNVIAAQQPRQDNVSCIIAQIDHFTTLANSSVRT